jgi:hypothetical protein
MDDHPERSTRLSASKLLKGARPFVFGLPYIAMSFVALGWWLFFAWVSIGYQCDDHCSVGSSDWYDTRGGWQWYAIGASPLLAIYLTFYLVTAVRDGRPKHAFGSWLLLAALVAVSLITLDRVTSVSDGTPGAIFGAVWMFTGLLVATLSLHHRTS